MKLRVDNILKPREWICLASGLVAAGAIYALMIHPSLQLHAELDRARAVKKGAQEELERVSTELQHVQHRIFEDKKRLAELGGSPPSAREKDLQIARLTRLARMCNVTIDQYSPIDTVEEEDHLAFFVQFTGRGAFSAVQRYLNRVESEIDFVDVTHFSITSAPEAAAPVCFLSLSCRINGMRTETVEPGRSVQRQAAGPVSLEVALHDP